MSEVMFRDVRDWMQENGWSVTDLFNEDEWGLTAVTRDGVRVTVEEPTVAVTDDVFIRSSLIEIDSVEKYREVKRKLSDPISIEFAGRTAKVAEFEGEIEHMGESDAVEKLVSEYDGFKIRLICTDRLDSVSLVEVGERVHMIETVYRNLCE